MFCIILKLIKDGTIEEISPNLGMYYVLCSTMSDNCTGERSFNVLKKI